MYTATLLIINSHFYQMIVFVEINYKIIDIHDFGTPISIYSITITQLNLT